MDGPRSSRELRKPEIGADFRVETKSADAIATISGCCRFLAGARATSGAGPRGFVRRETTAEVAAILGEGSPNSKTACPSVPYGAGSGVCGGAVGPEGGVVVGPRAGIAFVAAERVGGSRSRRSHGRDGRRARAWGLRASEAHTMGQSPDSEIDISERRAAWVFDRARRGQFSGPQSTANIEACWLAFEAYWRAGKVAQRARCRARTCAGLRRVVFLGLRGGHARHPYRKGRRCAGIRKAGRSAPARRFRFSRTCIAWARGGFARWFAWGWEGPGRRWRSTGPPVRKTARNFTGQKRPTGAGCCCSSTEVPPSWSKRRAPAAVLGGVKPPLGAAEWEPAESQNGSIHRNRGPRHSNRSSRRASSSTTIRRLGHALGQHSRPYEGWVEPPARDCGVLVASETARTVYTQGKTNLFLPAPRAAGVDATDSRGRWYFRLVGHAAMEADRWPPAGTILAFTTEFGPDCARDGCGREARVTPTSAGGALKRSARTPTGS